MVFSSFVFLFAFLPLVLLLYFCSPDKAKNAVLLAFSLLFYAWGEPLWIGVLLLNVAVGWAGGLLIERGRGRRLAKIAMVAALIFQVGVLVYFKYTGFLVHTLQPILPFPVPFRDPGLPIGISFFTFHLISYLVDVYRGDAPALRSYSKLLLYISLFPQLVAGPIIRYADVQEQLSRRRITLEGFSTGIARFVVGLGKKVVLANTLADISTVFLDGDLGKLSLLGAWFGIVLFALQIYFDFSGYSDMAIGLGRMFGFHFKENFNYPYVSRSASEFWRRWNISVGRFFRDYVYIPLGGNRRNPAFNLFAVWFLTGLWHGASWNYVLWGVYFGVFIAMERSFLFRILSVLPSFASHIYFLAIVLIGWVFFYFESIGRGLMYLRVMLGFASAPLANAELAIHLQNHSFLLPIAVIAATPLPAVLHRRLAAHMRPGFARGLYANTLVPLACLAILTVSALLLVGKTYSPFFYFRF
ncbi:MBOAT family O-acyltransferase [Paenibacillus elgii]|uniref:Alginate O-acetyltransferase n=1 Tax=Paenibacillus elgii TaxID=189691 RepID=A0A163ZM71_9BACL|nr:MBOAT family O-acyltransferase [Paenibacillus elgii]KZE82070.1 alginate O-acetyltransferase [Paenibacillus elgii]NEN81905.1 MBOAT family protein [Paenibacillus elgii]